MFYNKLLQVSAVPAGYSLSVTFVEEPEHVHKTHADNSTSVLVWTIQYDTCDYASIAISIKTSSHQLYPEDPFAPTQLGEDYTVECDQLSALECQARDNISEVNVTLTIHHNDNVFSNVPYVVCIVIDNMQNTHRSTKTCLKHGTTYCDTMESTPEVPTTNLITTTGKSLHTTTQTQTNVTTDSTTITYYNTDESTSSGIMSSPHQLLSLFVLFILILIITDYTE